MINTHYLYLLINFFTIIIPFIFSFHPSIQFYKHFLSFIKSIFLTCLIFIVWDIFFTHLGVWGFNKKYVIGVYFFNLPIEEVLFFICIPFACIFTIFCFDKFKKIPINYKVEKMIHIIIYFLSLSIILFFYKKKYPLFVFVSLPILIIVLKYIFKVNWLIKVYFVYLFLLIPFLIVNGILTGTGLQEPVVWYNVNQIIGIKILTIPVEDIFYGLELIILQYGLFEFIKSIKVIVGNRKNV